MRNQENRTIQEMMAQSQTLQQPIAARDALQIVGTVKRLSGINVDPNNSGFLRLRINRRLKELGLTDTDAYIARLNGIHGASEAQFLVESLATHTTDFFREQAHFDFLKTTGLPNLMQLGAGKEWPLVIWSAACSIGSELWTAGIVLHQFCLSTPDRLRWSLLGTDVSRRVLARAANAVFTLEELSGLSEDLRRAYILRSKPESQISAGGTLFRVTPDLRGKARFKWANLVDLEVGFSERADVAFMRNVLIYFKQKEKDVAIQNVLRRIRPGGYLITGHAEAISNLPEDLTQVAPSVYRKACNAK
jgi:chemotaxis protein methyltransferase CheR